MDKELFRKTEGKLYGYFKDKDKLENTREEIKMVNNLIEELDKKIRECNIKIDYNQGGMPLGERVQTSSTGTSYVERELIKGIDRMEQETAQRINKLFKLECEERNLKYKIDKMERNICMLKPEYKEFLRLKYSIGMGIREIALELNMCKNKAYDLREDLIKNIADYEQNWGTK